MKSLVAKSQSVRQITAESAHAPPPSQRAVNSLGSVCYTTTPFEMLQCTDLILQLIKFAENVDICRHLVNPVAFGGSPSND